MQRQVGELGGLRWWWWGGFDRGTDRLQVSAVLIKFSSWRRLQSRDAPFNVGVWFYIVAEENEALVFVLSCNYQFNEFV